MKKILLISFLILSFFTFDLSFAALWDTKILENMAPAWATILEVWKWTDGVDSFARYIKEFIFAVFYIVAVWVFIFLWARLISANWNAEDFKKALLWLVYAAVWIAIIPMAWALVKLVTGIEI